MRINTNASAIFAHRNLLRNTATQTKTLERLSSGLKINRGADAPAQLQISENLRAQTVGLKQSIDNSEMAISLITELPRIHSMEKTIYLMVADPETELLPVQI